MTCSTRVAQSGEARSSSNGASCRSESTLSDMVGCRYILGEKGNEEAEIPEMGLVELELKDEGGAEER